ncbi:MAG: hypothetical protein Q7S57_03425 [bacterium]|nr:hypothetical protein [bacterium]
MDTMQTQTTGDQKAQIYLRAEPTEDAKDLIMKHKVYLDKKFEKLGVKHKLVSRGDFHKTELFLDSAFNWNRALKLAGIEATVTYNDLLGLIEMKQEEREVTTDEPVAYEIFMSAQGYYVTVLRTKETAFQLKLQEFVKNGVTAWEKKGILPAGSADKLINHPKFLLARDLYAHKPHISLVRGFVKNENIRKVTVKVINETSLVENLPFEFERIDLRTVRSQRVINKFV